MSKNQLTRQVSHLDEVRLDVMFDFSRCGCTTLDAAAALSNERMLFISFGCSHNRLIGTIYVELETRDQALCAIIYYSQFIRQPHGPDVAIGSFSSRSPWGRHQTAVPGRNSCRTFPRANQMIALQNNPGIFEPSVIKHQSHGELRWY